MHAWMYLYVYIYLGEHVSIRGCRVEGILGGLGGLFLFFLGFSRRFFDDFDFAILAFYQPFVVIYLHLARLFFYYYSLPVFFFTSHSSSSNSIVPAFVLFSGFCLAGFV